MHDPASENAGLKSRPPHKIAAQSEIMAKDKKKSTRTANCLHGNNHQRVTAEQKYVSNPRQQSGHPDGHSRSARVGVPTSRGCSIITIDPGRQQNQSRITVCNTKHELGPEECWVDGNEPALTELVFG